MFYNGSERREQGFHKELSWNIKSSSFDHYTLAFLVLRCASTSFESTGTLGAGYYQLSVLVFWGLQWKIMSKISSVLFKIEEGKKQEKIITPRAVLTEFSIALWISVIICDSYNLLSFLQPIYSGITFLQNNPMWHPVPRFTTCGHTLWNKSRASTKTSSALLGFKTRD